MEAGYVRIFADDEGESHFEDLGVVLEQQDFAPPAGPVNIAPFQKASGTFWFGADPGWDGLAHPTPRRQIFCVVQGGVEGVTSDGEVRQLGPGAVIVLEDTEGKGHSTRVVGDEDLIMFGVTLD